MYELQIDILESMRNEYAKKLDAIDMALRLMQEQNEKKTKNTKKKSSTTSVMDDFDITKIPDFNNRGGGIRT
jgi:hypothetical protein